MSKIITTFILLITLSISAQGKLGDAKEDLKGSSSGTLDDYVSKNNSSSGSDDSGGSELNAAIAEVFVEVFWYVGANTLFGRAEATDLNIYPYYQNNAGEYIVYPEKDNDSTIVNTNDYYEYKKSDLKIASNYFVGNGINGVQTRLDFRIFYLLGIEASYNYYYEDLLDSTEHLDMAGLMLNYYRVRTKYVTSWWGIGATRVGGGVDTVGFAYNIGMDVFPIDPVSFHLLWKESFINSSSIDEFQVEAKYHMKRSAFYGGWHYNQLGNLKMNGIVFGFQYIIN